MLGESYIVGVIRCRQAIGIGNAKGQLVHSRWRKDLYRECKHLRQECPALCKRQRTWSAHSLTDDIREFKKHQGRCNERLANVNRGVVERMSVIGVIFYHDPLNSQ